MMHLEQENNIEQTSHEADVFHWVGIVLMVLSATLGWYALVEVCLKDFSAGKDAKWLMATPFLALLSFYIYRDFYRLIVRKVK